MNSLLATPQPPHHLHNIRLSPSHSSALMDTRRNRTSLSLTRLTVSHASGHNRKRKADDEEPPNEDHMASSPSESSSPFTRSLPAHTRPVSKRARSGAVGRPLTLPRLLETLDAQQLRGVLASMCNRHPGLTAEVETVAPRPSVPSALTVLQKYQEDVRSAFPFGGDPTSDYAFNRVRQHLLSLLDALVDFTPHFLAPNEPQATQSLQFLDGATDIIHQLPDWASYQNQIHKQNAYEEIAMAWSVTIREAAKRAGGMQLVYGGWDQKIRAHNERSGGKLQEALEELTRTSFAGGSSGGNGGGSHRQDRPDDLNALRQEMLNGAYGSGSPVRVGPW